MFWIIGGTLTAVTALAIAAPILRRKTRDEFRGRTQAIYVDQLNEVDRDEKMNLISPDEAESARTEIKRRMLSAARKEPRETATSGRKGAGLMIAAALAVPVLGGGLYFFVGHPGVPSLPYADRADERAEIARINKLVAKLRTRLEADPNSPVEGWVLLARTYMRLKRPTEAVWAYGKLLQRGDGEKDPEIYVLYAEAQIATDNGVVTPKSEAALDRALKVDPNNIGAIYYKATAYEQAGELDKAYAMLRDRIESETARKPWMESVAARANALAKRIGARPVNLPAAAAPGPSQADVAAAANMSDAQRKDFIRSMVARLAERLQSQPDDLDGWLRLGRAYAVLGEKENARNAYDKAGKLAAALPADDPRHEEIRKGLAGVALSE